MKKELEVIEVKPSGIKSWGGGAYTIAFVYSKHNGNFIVKGYMDEVRKYIESTLTHFFVNYTYWSNNGFRSYWAFWKSNYYIRQPERRKLKPSIYSPHKTRYKWQICNFSKENPINLQFRRFPNRWIK